MSKNAGRSHSAGRAGRSIHSGGNQIPDQSSKCLGKQLPEGRGVLSEEKVMRNSKASSSLKEAFRGTTRHYSGPDMRRETTKGGDMKLTLSVFLDEKGQIVQKIH